MTAKSSNIILWVCRLLAAVIMLQTLFFKFSASEESVYIFSKLKIEPWGRIASGVGELIASVLILIPATTWLGALLAIGVMTGAIIAHLTVLGIEVQGDSGQLFVYALTVFVCASVLLFANRSKLLSFLPGNSVSAKKFEVLN